MNEVGQKIAGLMLELEEAVNGLTENATVNWLHLSIDSKCGIWNLNPEESRTIVDVLKKGGFNGHEETLETHYRTDRLHLKTNTITVSIASKITESERLLKARKDLEKAQKALEEAEERYSEAEAETLAKEDAE